MNSRYRACQLTSVQLHHLDNACLPIREAFGSPPYLVGTAGYGDTGAYRDVDVRLILPDDEFAEAFPTEARWSLFCLAVSVYLGAATGLPVDFQVQRQTEASERFGRHSGNTRNPLGMGRVFAGGGDGTPEWETPDA